MEMDCFYLSQVFISQSCVLEYLWVKLYVFRSCVKCWKHPSLMNQDVQHVNNCADHPTNKELSSPKCQ